MKEVLLTNLEAKGDHTLGLASALEGAQEAALGNDTAALEHFRAADRRFEAAFNHLTASELTQTADGTVQVAHIQRDQGFTSTRRGIVTHNPDDFLRGRRFMRGALELTAGLVAGTTPARFAGQGKHDTPKLQRRELFTAHVATLDALARAAIATETTHRRIATTSMVQATVWHDLLQLVADDHLHGWAHQLGHEIGGYARTSNDINNARQEIARGRTPHAGVAFRRALGSLGWTLIHDMDDFKKAAGSIWHRLPALRSPEAAQTSILQRP